MSLILWKSNDLPRKVVIRKGESIVMHEALNVLINGGGDAMGKNKFSAACFVPKDVIATAEHGEFMKDVEDRIAFSLGFSILKTLSISSEITKDEEGNDRDTKFQVDCYVFTQEELDSLIEKIRSDTLDMVRRRN